jgi:hypothetical protein
VQRHEQAGERFVVRNGQVDQGVPGLRAEDRQRMATARQQQRAHQRRRRRHRPHRHTLGQAAVVAPHQQIDHAGRDREQHAAQPAP